MINIFIVIGKKMSRFGDLLGGQKPAPAPAPEPVVEEVLVTPEEEVLTELVLWKK